MEDNQSYRTAYDAAYARLIEQYEPEQERLFYDPVIKKIFNKPIQFLIHFKGIRKAMIAMYNFALNGIYGLQVCRTRYIDDALKNAINNGVEQLVILGAGLDTRPYRIPGIDKIRVFEVDMPIMQDKKKKKIEECRGVLPNNIIFTPIDFNNQTLDEVLTDKELDFSKPIFFIWEGVTQYISEESVKDTLKFISKASFGSIVVFTYILKSVIHKTSNISGADQLINYFQIGERTWSLGLDPLDIDNLLRQNNLTLIEDIGNSYYQENYLKPIGRNLAVSEIERVVYAKIT